MIDELLLPRHIGSRTRKASSTKLYDHFRPRRRYSSRALLSKTMSKVNFSHRAQLVRWLDALLQIDANCLTLYHLELLSLMHFLMPEKCTSLYFPSKCLIVADDGPFLLLYLCLPGRLPPRMLCVLCSLVMINSPAVERIRS